jgi:hypothetical protein
MSLSVDYDKDFIRETVALKNNTILYHSIGQPNPGLFNGVLAVLAPGAEHGHGVFRLHILVDGIS